MIYLVCSMGSQAGTSCDCNYFLVVRHSDFLETLQRQHVCLCADKTNKMLICELQRYRLGLMLNKVRVAFPSFCAEIGCWLIFISSL